MINLQFAQNLFAQLTANAPAQAQTNVVQALSDSFKPSENKEKDSQSFSDSLEPKLDSVDKRSVKRRLNNKEEENNVGYAEAKNVPQDNKKFVKNTSENGNVVEPADSQAASAPDGSSDAAADTTATAKPQTQTGESVDSGSIDEALKDSLSASDQAIALIDALLAQFSQALGQDVTAQLQTAKASLQQLVQNLQQISLGDGKGVNPDLLAQLKAAIPALQQVQDTLSNLNQSLQSSGLLQGQLSDDPAFEFASLLDNVRGQLQKIMDGFEETFTKQPDLLAEQALLDARRQVTQPSLDAKRAADDTEILVADQAVFLTTDNELQAAPLEPREAKSAPINLVVDNAQKQQATPTLQAAAIQQVSAVLDNSASSSATSMNNNVARAEAATSGAPFAAPIGTSPTQQKNQATFEHHVRHSEKGTPSEQVAFHMKSMVKDGVSKMIVKLDPPELGELEIKMQINRDGKVGMVVQVERPETLEMLQKDSRFLQQALQDAGLKADGNSLSFNLRGENSNGGQQRQGNNPYPIAEEIFDEELMSVVSERYVTDVQHGVNIRI